MNICPYCQGNLGDLNPVMDELAIAKSNGKMEFSSACCRKPITAFSLAGTYYIVDANQEPPRQMIGAA